MNDRFMLNTKTGVVFPYDALSLKANKHLVECSSAGVPIGRPGDNLDELYAEIDRLQKENAEKDFRISMLVAEVERLENEKIANDPKTIRRRELQDMTLEQLKELAAALGLTAKGNKADFVEAILEAE